jgi:hypothetical protein
MKLYLITAFALSALALAPLAHAKNISVAEYNALSVTNLANVKAQEAKVALVNSHNINPAYAFYGVIGPYDLSDAYRCANGVPCGDFSGPMGLVGTFGRD